MRKPKLRICDVSVVPLPGRDHECKASVDVNESGPYKFSLTIPVSCYACIITEFRQVGFISKPAHGEPGDLGPTELQRVLSYIFCAKIGLYFNVPVNAMKQPTEVPLGILDARDVPALVTWSHHRAHPARQQTARGKAAGK